MKPSRPDTHGMWPSGSSNADSCDTASSGTTTVINADSDWVQGVYEDGYNTGWVKGHAECAVCSDPANARPIAEVFFLIGDSPWVYLRAFWRVLWGQKPIGDNSPTVAGPLTG